MNEAYRLPMRKIDPSRGVNLADGTLNDNDRVEIGPTMLAYSEFEAAGLILPNLPVMRQYRLNRLVEKINERGYGGVLMFDPLNIRYATDSTNMQLWNTHNPFRACLLCADGYTVLWDYKNSPFLADHNPIVREVRSGFDLFYFDRGDKVGSQAHAVTAEVEDLIAAPGFPQLLYAFHDLSPLRRTRSSRPTRPWGSSNVTSTNRLPRMNSQVSGEKVVKKVLA